LKSQTISAKSIPPELARASVSWHPPLLVLLLEELLDLHHVEPFRRRLFFSNAECVTEKVDGQNQVPDARAKPLDDSRDGGNVGATTTYTFTAPSTPGTYFFRCDVHPETMTGQFIVT